MSFLEKAIRIAVQAHQGQKEKNGLPYVLHPIRLMLTVDTEMEMAAALLHDVIEDSDWTIEALHREGLPAELIEAVDQLTHRNSCSFKQYIRRIAENPLARKVKLADLKDNLNLRRLPRLGPRDMARLERYHWAWLYLQETKPKPAGS